MNLFFFFFSLSGVFQKKSIFGSGEDIAKVNGYNRSRGIGMAGNYKPRPEQAPCMVR